MPIRKYSWILGTRIYVSWWPLFSQPQFFCPNEHIFFVNERLAECSAQFQKILFKILYFILISSFRMLLWTVETFWWGIDFPVIMIVFGACFQIPLMEGCGHLNFSLSVPRPQLSIVPGHFLKSYQSAVYSLFLTVKPVFL